MSQPSPSKALQGLTVLDLTRVRAGPACVRPLADWGAAVIKLSRTPSSLNAAAPEHGQHPNEILAEMGYAANDIAELCRTKFI